ncbi:MAG: Tab2/Atab2 family RNA-binding protein [Cyanobacteriota bacterium]|nr:Tab2/Atab2 family RNA-binding protein [Cyanobacteriota bacterium]
MGHSETIWQMDFWVTPLRDDQDKRVWQLLVCDSSGSLRQAFYGSNQQVNSSWVGERLKELIEARGMTPSAIRVFRGRMTSILQRGCDLVGIPLLPSRRVYALAEWMRQRVEQVYLQESAYRYDPLDLEDSEAEPADPSPLPDKVLGERWALVSMTVSDLASAELWTRDFGESFSLANLPLADEVVVPGLVIISRRALPLAAWMSGLEPAYLRLAPTEASLVLEVGQSDCYRVARLNSASLQQEGEAFEAQKKQVYGIHFLAIQTDLQARSFSGFWLLRDGLGI